MKKLIILITSGFLLFPVFQIQEKRNRNYFRNEFNFEKISHIEPRFIQFGDTIPNDTIYICFTTNNFPYAYFREIFTPVCIDGLCLPIFLNLYWSPGGNYLGYSLKNNGILTKGFSTAGVSPDSEKSHKGFAGKYSQPFSLITDTSLKHVPFVEEDYFRLHYLLEDQHSLLKNYKLSELVSNDQDKLKVDGISGATIKEVENYVIKGAVFTTYQLWHTVYGSSYDSIRKISLEYLSTPFLENLIYSPYIEDNNYALNVLNRFEPKVTMSLIPKLKEFITSDNSSLKGNSINALMSSGISDSLIQETLLNVFKESDYWTKKMVLSKLNNFTFLIPDIVEKLISNLSKESPSIIQEIFNLLRNRTKLNLTSKMEIANLLQDDNMFIAKLTYNFISSLDNNEKILIDKMNNYIIKIKRDEK